MPFPLWHCPFAQWHTILSSASPLLVAYRYFPHYQLHIKCGSLLSASADIYFYAIREVSALLSWIKVGGKRACHIDINTLCDTRHLSPTVLDSGCKKGRFLSYLDVFYRAAPFQPISVFAALVWYLSRDLKIMVQQYRLIAEYIVKNLPDRTENKVQHHYRRLPDFHQNHQPAQTYPFLLADTPQLLQAYYS